MDNHKQTFWRQRALPGSKKIFRTHRDDLLGPYAPCSSQPSDKKGIRIGTFRGHLAFQPSLRGLHWVVAWSSHALWHSYLLVLLARLRLRLCGSQACPGRCVASYPDAQPWPALSHLFSLGCSVALRPFAVRLYLFCVFGVMPRVSRALATPLWVDRPFHGFLPPLLLLWFSRLRDTTGWFKDCSGRCLAVTVRFSRFASLSFGGSAAARSRFLRISSHTSAMMRSFFSFAAFSASLACRDASHATALTTIALATRGFLQSAQCCFPFWTPEWLVPSSNSLGGFFEPQPLHVHKPWAFFAQHKQYRTPARFFCHIASENLSFGSD